MVNLLATLLASLLNVLTQLKPHELNSKVGNFESKTKVSIKIIEILKVLREVQFICVNSSFKVYLFVSTVYATMLSFCVLPTNKLACYFFVFLFFCFFPLFVSTLIQNLNKVAYLAFLKIRYFLKNFKD